MTVVPLDVVADDLETGWWFYEFSESGIGDYFVESILADLDSLALHAGLHSLHFGFHRKLSKKFPFGIYYEVESDTVYVYAVLDMRRDPSWIRRELQRRR